MSDNLTSKPLVERLRENDTRSDRREAADEIERLQQRVAELEGIRPEFPPLPGDGKELPRYGIRWNGPKTPLSVPMSDGYWTPWHLAMRAAEPPNEILAGLLREVITEDDDSFFMGEGWRERADKALAAETKTVTPDQFVRNVENVSDTPWSPYGNDGMRHLEQSDVSGGEPDETSVNQGGVHPREFKS